jgi:hypothetical protein
MGDTPRHFVAPEVLFGQDASCSGRESATPMVAKLNAEGDLQGSCIKPFSRSDRLIEIKGAESRQ